MVSVLLSGEGQQGNCVLTLSGMVYGFPADGHLCVVTYTSTGGEGWRARRESGESAFEGR